MNRLFIIISLIIYALLPLPAHTQELLKIENPIRVVSYNIRFDNPGDRQHIWDNRRDRVINVLKFHKADIFCLQEPLMHQIGDIEKAFPGFAWYGLGREDGDRKGEFNPVFYNKSRFNLLEKGTFWLSETPDVPGSLGWFAKLPRIATWVKLLDRATGREFFVFNTHLDHQSQQARERGAELILAMINDMAGDLPVVLAGDFNDRPGTAPYNKILDAVSPIQMFDARLSARYSHHGPSFTYVGLDFMGVPGRIIDYIFVSPGVFVDFHAYLTDNWDGIFPSDHLPVLIEMKLK
jgi:endonuclease/exonuclease/phosphatase family metal-dependent hydrolase